MGGGRNRSSDLELFLPGNLWMDRTKAFEKGRKTEAIQIKHEAESDSENYVASLAPGPTDGALRRAAFRNNITTILHTCTAYPFKYRKGTYLCFYCKMTFLEPEKLREHNTLHHSQSNQLLKPKKYEPLKMDFSNTSCRLCDTPIEDYASLKSHLTEHGKIIDCTWGDSVLPYKLSKEEHRCQVCGKRYEMFLSLHKHMNDHYEHYICETCGKRFATSQRMVNHSRTHERGVFPCKHCAETFQSYSSLYAHIAKVHKLNKRYKCPICDEKFGSYKHRLKHLNTVHGEKTAVFPCPSCPKVFDLCSRRTAHIRFQHLQERNHICSVCGMKFFTNYELQEHSIKHGGERIYQCDVCKKAYARLKTLREHMRIHNNDRRFVCPVCGQSFIQNCSLKQHMRVHHPTHLKDVFCIDEKPESRNDETETKRTTKQTEDIAARKKRAYTLLECSRICPFRWMKNLYYCFYCDAQFSDPADLREHHPTHSIITPALLRNGVRLKKYELIKVDITNVGCKLCDDTIHDFHDLKLHLLKKHAKDIDQSSDGVLPFRITKDSFKCALCDKICDEFKSLNQHMNVHYQNFICEQCGSGFVTPDRLRVHTFSHGTGDFKCDAEGCEKVFRSKNNKNEHYAIVHMKRKRHRCPQCPETFINYFQRSKHISIIHGVKLKEFKCDLCPKVFTLSGKLGAHIRTAHMQMKRFTCEVCSWKVYSRTELKQHMMKHVAINMRFHCNACKKSYAREYSLKQHMRVHENCRRFICGACGKGFIQAFSLSKHVKTYHPDSVSVHV